MQRPTRYRVVVLTSPEPLVVLIPRAATTSNLRIHQSTCEIPIHRDFGPTICSAPSNRNHPESKVLPISAVIKTRVCNRYPNGSEGSGVACSCREVTSETANPFFFRMLSTVECKD